MSAADGRSDSEAAAAVVAIDEEEYLNEALLKSSPITSDQQQQHQQQDEAARRSSLAGRLSGVVGADLQLPVRHLAKSLGAASASGISGVGCVRGPLARLTLEAARRRVATGAALPVVQLSVLPHGLGVGPPEKLQGQQPTGGGGGGGGDFFFPIETISYAVMDTRMPRLFCIVSVQIAASGAPVNPTCHVFLCASIETCYRLVLAVTAAFNSAVNRSKAARRRRSETAPAADAASSTAASHPQKQSDRVVHLAFTGDHEEA